MSKKLIFIYNANNDTRSKMFDFAHKIMSPATYDCKLCSLTFGNFTEKKQWKNFRESLQRKGYTLSFLHKDEFQHSYKSKFGHAFAFPIVLFETEHDLQVVLTTEKLNEMDTVEELIIEVQGTVDGINKA